MDKYILESDGDNLYLGSEFNAMYQIKIVRMFEMKMKTTVCFKLFFFHVCASK